MKLSIIIPTIGRKTLKEVLQALLDSSDFTKIEPEILVVFDGMISRPPIKHQNISYFSTPKKVYAAGARNFAIKKSTGDILIFIGDDIIPSKNWLKAHYQFHKKNKAENAAMLGHISWPERYKDDPFYQFLENGPQSNFKKIAKKGATWRNFYTGNISVKKVFLADERFSLRFHGWGFEDIELGYRLYKKGLKISYDPTAKVIHEDPQTLQQMIDRTKNSRKNAATFQQLHPELQILPTGIKKTVLQILVTFMSIFGIFNKKAKYWALWKKAWLN